MILWSESDDTAATEIKYLFLKSKQKPFLECFECSDKINALETDKSMRLILPGPCQSIESQKARA
jgi:hypothetical protein